VFFFCGATDHLGTEPLILRFLDHIPSDTHTHTHTHTQSAGIFRTCDKPRLTGRCLHKTLAICDIHAPAEFEPEIPEIKRLQTYALDRTDRPTTGIYVEHY